MNDAARALRRTNSPRVALRRQRIRTSKARRTLVGHRRIGRARTDEGTVKLAVSNIAWTPARTTRSPRCSCAKVCAASRSHRPSGATSRSTHRLRTSRRFARRGRIAGFRSSRFSRCSSANRSFSSSPANASERADRSAPQSHRLRRRGRRAGAGVRFTQESPARPALDGRRDDDRPRHVSHPRAACARTRGGFLHRGEPARLRLRLRHQNARRRRALPPRRRAIHSRERGPRWDDPVERGSGGLDLASGGVRRTRARKRAALGSIVIERRARTRGVGACRNGILRLGLDRDARAGVVSAAGGAGARRSRFAKRAYGDLRAFRLHRSTGPPVHRDFTSRDVPRLATRFAKRPSTAPT